ncbi:hypothetical protein VitviT2T_003052 [Vitis vinifera]|uniref:Disease resistance protein n=1 Tax=Vitis vinifera TaxID=29760 RepID=A0ABY9BL36_VITVI|nr:hypothetical protein VitviT2T_003052 [Vitis vinifera]
MAEAILFCALERIGDLLIQQADFLGKVGDDVQLLQTELRRMQCFLKDASARQEEDQKIRNWVAEIRDVAYDAEDVVESYILKVVFRRGRSIHTIGNMLATWEVGSEIEDIKAKISNLTRSLETYGIRPIREGDDSRFAYEGRQQLRRTYSHLVEDDVVGLEDKTKELKCLVILDDLWTMQAWNSLRPAFPIGKSRSKILLTTRNKDVATYVDPKALIHEVQCLTEEMSWELLQKKAMLPGGHDFTWERLGMKMVRHCGGLPVAIIVLGGLLATKHTLKDWEMVYRNINSYLRRGKGHEQEFGGVSEVLASSYYDLPYQLKPCFLYLGHFPEDFEIPTKKLMRMWVAEGIVSSVQGETAEDVAERYLDELIERCMVQVGRRNFIGRVKTCRLHDLMRDLCLSKAKEENFLQATHLRHKNDPVAASSSMVPIVTPMAKIRRLAIYLDEGVNRCISSEYEKSSHLRSLLFFYAKEVGMINWEQLKPVFNNFKLLRVLDLEGFKITEHLPKAIRKLVHLRYLNLRNSKVRVLPSSIGNLVCLHNLDLSFDLLDGLQRGEIPNVIWKMEQLSHLYLPKSFTINGADKLRLDSLNNLKTLRNVDARKCCIKDLVKLTNLSKLGMHSVKSYEELKVILKHPSPILNSLWLLSLQIWGERVEEKDLRQLFSDCHHDFYRLSLGAALSKLPEYNSFPPNLIKLTLWGSRLVEDPMPTLGKLPHLQFLRLPHTYFGKEIVCLTESFPRLKYLFISNFPKLEKWKIYDTAMPSLLELQIRRCEQLKKLPDGLRLVTTLRELEIIEMPNGFLNRLKVGGEDFYKVQQVHSIKLWARSSCF